MKKYHTESWCIYPDGALLYNRYSDVIKAPVGATDNDPAALLHSSAHSFMLVSARSVAAEVTASVPVHPHPHPLHTMTPPAFCHTASTLTWGQ